MVTFFNSANNKAFEAWKKDKEKRTTEAVKAIERGDVKSVGKLRLAPTAKKTMTSYKGNSYDWEKSTLHDLPKSMGRSYNEKFANYAKSMGLDYSTANEFRKFLDAKEKGQLGSDYDEGLYNNSITRGLAGFTTGDAKDKSPIVPNERGTLDRIFDPLLIGNYVSASVANNVFNKKEGWKGAWEGIKDGVKAANPFGEGHEEGEMTYSKVFKEAGWKPKSTGGKVAQGAAGFVADVLLDPTTYMTFGASAVLKGTGRSAVSAKKLGEAGAKLGLADDALKTFKKGTMTPDVAKQIVSEQAARTGKVLDETTLATEAEKLSTRFHQVLGTNREGVGLGVGLKHSIANPLIKFTVGKMDNKVGRAFNALADSHIELPGSAKAAQKVGDVLNHVPLANYKNLRKVVYGTRMGKLFSSKHGLMKLAESDPAKIYDLMDMVAKSQGFHADKIKEETLIKDYVKQNLSDLTPVDQKKLVEALQDKTVLSTIKRVTKIGGMSEAKQLRNTLERERQLVKDDLDALTNQMDEINTLRSKSVQDLDGGREVLRQAERDYQTALANLDLSKIKNKDQYNTAIKLLQQQADELEAKHFGTDTPLRPADEVLDMDEPIAPKRPYTKNPQKPELDTVPEKPVYPDAPKREDFEPKEFADMTDLQKESHTVLSKWKSVGDSPNQYQIDEAANEFSQLIYGKTGEISSAIYPFSLNNLAKLVEKGSSTKFIKEYIENNKMYYDGRAKDIFSHAGDVFKYGGIYKHKSWNEFYTEQMRALKNKYEDTSKMSDADFNLFEKLERTRLERAVLISELSMMDKTELKKYMTNYANQRMWDDLRTVEKREFKGKGSKDPEEARRERFQAEDRSTESRRTGEFDDKTPDFTLNDLEVEAVRGKVVMDLFGKDGEIPSLTQAQYNAVDKIIAEVNPLLEQFFQKSYTRLSPGAQKFLLGMAKQHALVDMRGGTKSVDDIVKKQLAEKGKFYEKLKHVEAVKAITTVGSPIVVKNSKNLPATGKVIAVNTDIDGNVLYNIRTNKGELLKDVNPEKVIQSRGVKPIDAVLDNMAEREIQRKLSEATKVYESTVKELDDAYNAKLAEVESGNAEKLAQYQKELTDIDAVKKEKKAQYDADMKKYQDERDTFFNEAERVLKVNEANQADWEKAIRDSSKMADDYFTEKQAIFDKIKGESTRRLQNDLNLSGKQARIHELLGKRYEKAVENVVELEQTVKDIDEQLARFGEDVDVSHYDTEITRLSDELNTLKGKNIPRELDETVEESVATPATNFEIQKVERDIKKAESEIKRIEDMFANNSVGRDVADYEKTKLEAYKKQLARSKDDLDHLQSTSSVSKTVTRTVKKANPEYTAHQQSIKKLEGQLKQLQKNRGDALSTGNKSMQDLETRLDELNDALKSDEAFENFIQLKHAEDLKKWDKKYGNSHVGETILDASSEYSDTVKRLAHELRANFKVFGADEVRAGKMTEEQFASWVDEYLPHLVTPSGSKFFKKWKLQYDETTGTVNKVERTKADGQPSVTQDLGYGEAFSEYSLSRQIKKLKMPDGTWVERPTIEQINEVMKPYLNGKNAFSENIADIYVSRAMKHTELMYDEKYMNEMLRTFGRELPADLIPEAGHKAVMNFGLFKRNLNELSNLQVSIHISEDVGEYVRTTLTPQFGRGMSPDEMEKEIGKYVASKYTPDVIEGLKNDFHDTGYNMLGLQRDTFRSIATPMVEVNPQQITSLQEKYNEVLGQFANNLMKQQDNAARYGATPAQLERIKKNQDKLANLTQLEYKQVHESIVEKANQARQLQMAKDGNKLVKLYDKFTHFMKLNQTAVMPSFHMRNAYSNLFQVWLAVGNDVWDMQTHKAAFKTNLANGTIENLKHLDPLIIRNKKGQEISRMDWDEVYSLAKSHSVINEGFFAKDLEANDASGGFIKSLQDIKVPKKDDVHISLDPTDTRNFIGYKAGGSAGNFVENQARLFQFASHIKQGMTPEQAKAMVDKYLFDYGDLTSFEQNVMKRIFPYYTWLRKNGRLQVSQVLEQPGKYRDVAKFMNGVEGGVDEEDKVQNQYLSNFAKNWAQTPFNYTTTDEDGNEIVEPILWSPNLPFMDLTRLPSPNPLNQDQTLMNMIPQTNPLIKGAMELGTNKNFFFDDNIYDTKDSQGEPTSAGYKAGKIADYGLRQFAPYTAVADTIKKDGLDKSLHLMNQFSGQKYLSYDYEKSKDMAIQKYLNPPKEEDVLWVDKQLKALDNAPRKAQGKITDKLVSYINKQPNTLVAKTVEGTSLDKYLLGNDIAMAKVTGVRDGDTIEVDINGKTEAVRFNLVDSPEISHTPAETSMPFGDEASSLTRNLTEGKDVRLVISKQKDMHGRLMAYVYVDGEDINRKLLEEGLGTMRYVNLSTNPYNESEYRKVQEEASGAKRGLWQLDGYADPEKEGYNKRGAMKKYLEMMGGGN